MKEMPICILNNQYNWSIYIKKIEKSMKSIQKKIKHKKIHKLTIYKRIVLIYMIDIFSNQCFADIISPMELYNITHFFFSNNDDTKEKKLLMELENIDEMVSSSFINKENNIKWNIFKHIKLKSKDEIIVGKLNFPIIGYSEYKITHIMLESSFNNLNFWDIIMKCFIERFLIYNHSEKDNVKYKDKDIETFIYILDEGKCEKINWNWDKNLHEVILEEIKLSIQKYYSNYHNSIYNYLIQVKSSDNNGKYWGKGTEFKTPFLYISHKIKNETTLYPISYIYNLFDPIYLNFSFYFSKLQFYSTLHF